MESNRSTRVTARFTVMSDDGQRINVVEHTTFVRARHADGTWTEPAADVRRYSAGAHPVSVNPDGTFAIVIQGAEVCFRRS
jgi:hypothetical protein